MCQCVPRVVGWPGSVPVNGETTTLTRLRSGELASSVKLVTTAVQSLQTQKLPMGVSHL
jgi:hypothetical protein